MKFISDNANAALFKKIKMTTFTLIFLLSGILVFAETNFFDSVNARKAFFNSTENWDKLVDTKTYFENRNIGLITIYDIPLSIPSSIYSNQIMNILTDKNDISVFESNYKLIRIKNPNKKNDDYFYILNQDIPDTDILKIKKILKATGFKAWDYYMVFYDTSSEEKKTTAVKINDELTASYVYGKTTYQFDHDKNLIEVKVYFHDGNNSYIQFNKYKPQKFDVYMFSKLVKKNQPYYFPFESLTNMSTTSLLSLLDDESLKKETLITVDDLEVKQTLIEKIILPALDLEYNEDGAINEFGKFVNIADEKEQSGEKGVNCSGFVKEVVDNYIRLEKPDFKRLPIDDLKKKRIFEREKNPYRNIEDEYDLFFGLDWAKNLSDKINEYYDYKVIKAEELDDDENLEYYEYLGYQVKNLKEILFRDQNKDSRYFYILAFNKLRTTLPTAPAYYHLAIVFPIFGNSHFFLRTFESAEETNFGKLIERHKDEKVVIIKIPLPYIHLLE